MGTATGEIRSLAEFREIVLDGFGSVHFTQGPASTLAIKGDPDPARAPHAQVRDGVLYLGTGHSSGKFQILIRKHPLVFRVTGPYLDRITIKGVARATVAGLHAPRLNVEVDGAGDIRLQDLELEELRVRIGGAGKLDATGSADRQEIEITGTGSFSGTDLVGQRAAVSINGAGKANVNATDSLQISIGGVGSVTYLGDPVIQQSVGGLGRVKRAADTAPSAPLHVQPSPPPPPAAGSNGPDDLPIRRAT